MHHPALANRYTPTGDWQERPHWFQFNVSFSMRNEFKFKAGTDGATTQFALKALAFLAFLAVCYGAGLIAGKLAYYAGIGF